MKWKNFGLVVFTLVFGFTPLHAATTYTIPLQNIILNPNTKLTANYSFGPNAIIFCYSNVQETSTGNVTWRYKGKAQSAPLPITLVTNTNYEGELADASGVITVSNTTSGQTVNNCVFAF